MSVEHNLGQVQRITEAENVAILVAGWDRYSGRLRRLHRQLRANSLMEAQAVPANAGQQDQRIRLASRPTQRRYRRDGRPHAEHCHAVQADL